MRKRTLTLILFAALALSVSACGKPAGGTSSASSIHEEAAPSELTEADVLAAYEKAAEVYDWFDLCSLPTSGDPVAEDGNPYDPKQAGLSYRAVAHKSLKTYADLDVCVRSCFTQELADKLMGSGTGYRDIDGRLYSADAARGSNLYLLGKAARAEQTDENHWAVTVTFYADSYEWEVPLATVGYSQKTLDYIKTPDGWRFSTFCPSDALDETAKTVFHFSYGDPSTMEQENMADWPALKLACWLLHADGAFSEGASDHFALRLLNHPDEWFAALSAFPDSPWEYRDSVITHPAWSIYGWHPAQEDERLEALLNAYQPKNSAETALLNALKTAWMQATQLGQDDADAAFCLVAEEQCLTLGKKDGAYPWLYKDFAEKPTSVGTGDNGEKVYAFSYGGVDVKYVTYSDEGGETSLVSRMETASPAVKTWWGVSVGDKEDDILAVYPDAKYTDRIRAEDGDGAWVWPGDEEMLGSHITFYMKDGAVSEILMENLSD
ncbi:MULTISPECIES: hypothetical protein [unclassified Oscillibacter]|uniref:hypothetical protein n=1 Tax=unclassified Oscillibacter TaxID=2629304 RepID=UPI0025D0BC64|nr:MULTISPECIES: hypothetical protein [unclassified Oscillibacter]